MASKRQITLGSQRRGAVETAGRSALTVLTRPRAPDSDTAELFAPVLSCLRCHFDVDLAVSATPALFRRIRRRMALADVARPLDYADRLAVDREEAEILLGECLAGEFGLLRDREAFAALTENVVAPLAARLGGEREIRIWVAGCGAGEDAYALAIGFSEAAAFGAALDFKILATESESSALAAAVAGRFALDALAALSPDLIERYFEPEGDGARAKPELRRRIVFNRHDVLADPPFARIDLVSCRHRLAAQPQEARARALRLFRSALTPGGLLLLGGSESLGEEWRGSAVPGSRIFSRSARDAREAASPAEPAESLGHPTRDLEALLQAAEIGAVFLDEASRVRRFTPAAARAFALSANDIGRGIAEVAPRFQGVDLARLLDEVGNAGAKREVEISVEGRAYLLRVLPHRGAGASISGAVVTVIDVDALKTARRRVRDLNRRNQTVIESLSETIVSWDPKSEHILFSNEAFAQTLDLSVEDLLGRPLAAVLHPEVYRHKRSAMAALETQPFVTSLVRTPKPSGEIVWRSMRYTRVTGFDGRLTAYLACGRDVSDQMRYVEALEALAGIQTPIDQPFESFAAEALKIGAGLLGVPYAALAQSGERRRVACVVGLDRPPDPALCERALAKAQEIASRPEDAVSELPAEGRLAACIGVAVRSGAEIYGAICFFSPQAPAFGPLTEIQRGFVRHVAQWIGMKIEIHRQHLSLRRSEAELRLIFDNVSQNIWRLDRSHRVRWANAGAAQAMGLGLESVIGAPADAFMQRLDPKWRAHGEAAFGSQTPYYGVEAEFRQQGETPQWTSTDFTPDNEGPEGEPSLLVVSSDITLLKEREAELELAIADADHTRRLYQRHYRRTPVLLCSFQTDGRVVEASDLWREKTGYDREEVVGRRLGEFMDEPSRLRAETQALPELWRTGACEAAPLRFLAKSGAAMDFELSGFRSAEDGGAPLCLAVLVDVTARNAAETALERANRDLAVVNDGLKKFAHVASHDLQEPLRKIRQFGDLLISEHRQELSGDAALYVDVMRDSSERMRNLIRDILDFSRSINATMSRTRLPLAEIARDILSELEIAVQEAGAEVGIGQLASLLGDRIAVQMLMRNLIGNSLKYRRPGVTPQISVSGAWASEAEYVLSFKDNGSGIDPRYHDIVFDAFTRLHPHGQARGSGLGLAICKSVCERQQWRIGVKSAPGEGAEFTVAIPAADVVSDGDRARRG